MGRIQTCQGRVLQAVQQTSIELKIGLPPNERGQEKDQMCIMTSRMIDSAVPTPFEVLVSRRVTQSRKQEDPAQSNFAHHGHSGEEPPKNVDLDNTAKKPERGATDAQLGGVLQRA
eukprot:5437055-Amphidinium_carterae.1